MGASHPFKELSCVCALITALACCLGASLNAVAADVKSISRLAAGPGNILFVADWKAARVHAISLPAAQQPAGAAFNILDLESLLSAQVGGARSLSRTWSCGLVPRRCTWL